jgi:pimeloyl-ACP methyl ester carboxylesterase
MSLTEGYLSTPDGIRLFFQKIGTGPDVVIIPNAAYMFDDFSHLAEHRTVVFYDLRNRGRSDAVTDEAKLKRGIHNDVGDLEAVREYSGAASVTVLGHSYLGFVVALYAMQYPQHVNRVIQIGAGQPLPGKQYPPNLRGADAILAETNSKLMELQKEGPSGNPEEFGRKMWSLMKPLYVANPDDAGKIRWSVEHLANESFTRLMTYYATYLLPSVQSTNLTADDFARAKMPVLTIHGTRDRHAPYGGARDWASMLPDARLVTIEGAAHLPWIESPRNVFDSIHTFLDGGWPEYAERIDHAGAI